MLSMDDLDRTILELESKDTSFAVCEKLAWLYIVRDHIEGRTQARGMMQDAGDSEFMSRAKAKPYDLVLGVMNDLMELMRTMKPNVYMAIITQLDTLPNV